MKLIFIDGVEGSGKSTLINNLKCYYENQQLSVSIIKFPTYIDSNNGISKCLKNFVFGDYNYKTDVVKFSIMFSDNILNYDRINNITTDIVICDRSIFSTYVYQCSKFKDSIDITDDIMKSCKFVLPKDITIVNYFLYADIDTLTTRLFSRIKTNKYNEDSKFKLKYLTDLYTTSMEACKIYEHYFGNILYIDTTKLNEDEVLSKLLNLGET